MEKELKNAETGWRRFFLAAALFNYMIGLAIVLATRFSFDLTYLVEVPRDPMTLRLWWGFGFAVLLIGVGYQIVSRNLDVNRGVVLLGIGAKGYDVINLTTLYLGGMAHPLVLLPAAIDAGFTVGFIIFLRLWPQSSGLATPKTE